MTEEDLLILELQDLMKQLFEENFHQETKYNDNC
jgi:hypothetical protein